MLLGFFLSLFLFFFFPPCTAFHAFFFFFFSFPSVRLPTRSTVFFNESPDVGLLGVELSWGLQPATQTELCIQTQGH